jgi:uncharacterized membrane protein
LFNLLLAGLVSGTLFGIVFGYNPASLSAQAYIEQQQNAIRSLNTLMPVLGFVTIILTLTAAILQRKDRTVFILLLVSSFLFITSGLVTRFGNQPINSIVMTWDPLQAPVEWPNLRDRWWSFHVIRTVTSIVAFCLISVASLRKSDHGINTTH